MLGNIAKTVIGKTGYLYIVTAEGKLIMPADLGLEAPTSPELQNVLDVARQKAERGAIYSSLQQTGRNRVASTQMTLVQQGWQF